MFTPLERHLLPEGRNPRLATFDIDLRLEGAPNLSETIPLLAFPYNPGLGTNRSYSWSLHLDSHITRQDASIVVGSYQAWGLNEKDQYTALANTLGGELTLVEADLATGTYEGWGNTQRLSGYYLLSLDLPSEPLLATICGAIIWHHRGDQARQLVAS